MAPSPRAVLLPKLFPTSSFALGQLLPNPLKPTVFSHKASIIPLEPRYVTIADPEAPYSTFVSLAREGYMNVSLTKLLGLNMTAQSGNFLKIDAEEMQYTSLALPEAVFKLIATEDAGAEWIKSMAKHHKDFYVVTGLQVLKSAKFQRVIFKEGKGGGHITVPLDTVGQLPIHAGGGVMGTGFGAATAGVDGVFGIEVRKVKCSFWKPGEKITDEISWVFAHEQTKGNLEGQEEHLSVRLGETVGVEELESLLKAAEELDEEDE